jgi:hypothetical protein
MRGPLPINLDQKERVRKTSSVSAWKTDEGRETHLEFMSHRFPCLHHGWESELVLQVEKVDDGGERKASKQMAGDLLKLQGLTVEVGAAAWLAHSGTPEKYRRNDPELLELAHSIHRRRRGRRGATAQTHSLLSWPDGCGTISWGKERRTCRR